MSDKRQQALVVAFLRNRGFGFLRAPDLKEHFFHVSNFNGKPELGMTVEFELGEPTKLGQPQQAIRIEPVESNTPIITATAEKKVSEGGAL